MIPDDTTTLGVWLRGVGAQAASSLNTHRIAVPGIGKTDRDARGDVFLSVIMRTQGKRPQEMREALLTLAGQSSTDFEVVVVAHRTSRNEMSAVERVIDEQPEFLRTRIRILALDRGLRGAPLNVGLAAARGRYIGVFDDDDLVLGDWVAEMAALEHKHAGRIIRVVTMRQDVVVDRVHDLPGVRAVSAPQARYNETFSFLDHLSINESPPIGFIFPRSLYTDFGVAYDEELATQEDYDFLLRASQIAGVVTVDKVLAIYHWWLDGGSSRTMHSPEVWAEDLKRIHENFDSRPLLLPVPDVAQLRETRAKIAGLEQVNLRQQIDLDLLRGNLVHAEHEVERHRQGLRREIRRVETLRKRVKTLKSRLEKGDKVVTQRERAAPQDKVHSMVRRAGRGIKRRLS